MFNAFLFEAALKFTVYLCLKQELEIMVGIKSSKIKV